MSINYNLKYMNKKCGKCKETKEISSFSKNARRKDGFAWDCKTCHSILTKEKYKNNKIKILEKAQKRYQENREEILEYIKEYKVKNKCKVSKNNKNWKANNPGKHLAHGAKRRSRKNYATPVWLTKEQLKDIELLYIKATKISKFNKKYHVDHIVPLIGVNKIGEHIVCGLHVPWNLQILSAKKNLEKSNKLEICINL